MKSILTGAVCALLIVCILSSCINGSSTCTCVNHRDSAGVKSYRLGNIASSKAEGECRGIRTQNKWDTCWISIAK